VTLGDQDSKPAEALSVGPDRLTSVEVDLADAAATELALKPLSQSSKAPDFLINGVGWPPKSNPQGEAWTVWNMPIDHFNHVVAVNLTAVFQCTGLFVPAMIKRGHGRAINIGALAARVGGKMAPINYVSAKSGVLGLTKVVARELSGTGGTINAINPDRIDTKMIRDVPDEVNQAIAANIPVDRLGTPDDVANTCLYLASDLADYLSGTALEVNGGLYVGP
jgi:3-oxoacyl-[acyl-carrier protein] reductase